MDQVIEKQYGLTNIHACKLSFEWKIYNYKLNGKKVGESLLSPEFSDSDKKTKWVIKCYPTGNTNDNKDYLSLFLYLKTAKETAKVEADFKLYIIKQDGKKYLIAGGANTFIVTHGFGRQKCIKKDSMLNDTYLPNDCFTIVCDLSISLNKVTSKTDIIHDNLASNQKIEHQLLSNYKSLFNNEDIHDVTIIASGRKFYAHKAILAAHSPVFLTMLNKNNFKENVEKKIDISDIDSNVFQELLRFIYSGEIENMNDIVHELLVAADKYLIKELLNKCEKYLESKLSIDNVTSIVSLADNCNATNLRRTAINFLMVHRKTLKLDVCKFLKTLKRHTVEEIAKSSIIH